MAIIVQLLKEGFKKIEKLGRSGLNDRIWKLSGPDTSSGILTDVHICSVNLKWHDFNYHADKIGQISAKNNEINYKTEI